ncbi:MAG: hypothetical protein IKJ83_02145 [Ruminococcus sp.]|nr:hypothetical protein [Ruminococcus sp.]
MKNPFILYDDKKKTEYINHSCSINRVRLAKLPLYGIEDGIEGYRANEIFSAKIISEDVFATAQKMRVDASDYSFRELPRFLSAEIMSDEVLKRRIATTLSTKYGNRLGLILLALRLGQEENRAVREDWTQEHWDYWANVKNVVLTGGLASGLLGKRFKEQIHYIFDVAGVKPYNISLFENSSHVGAMGCTKLIEENDKTFAVLDFGQTHIKRCIIRKRAGEIASITTLPTEPSLNMDLTFAKSKENYDRALELHRYLLKVICDTCRDIELTESEQGEVIISIANYVIGGELNSHRGGYAKLHLLCEDYATLISDELSSRMHRPYRARLVHDGTAIALNFNDREDTVCLSIGTAFGVGFPEVKLRFDN